MNLAEWHRHSFLNRLQSLLLIGFMAGFLALLGHLRSVEAPEIYAAVTEGAR